MKGDDSMAAKISRRDTGKLLATLPALACASALINGPAWAEASIRAADPHPRRRVKVLDTEIEYVDTGRGDPIVFLHGNPTYSYQWRNIIPFVSKLGRCLAPDLVGMGRSGTSPKHSYRFIDHARYLDAWFDALGLTKNVILVVHDWGAAIGFYRASRLPSHVQGVAYFEAIVAERHWPEMGANSPFRVLRSERGEHLVLDENFFVEVVLPSGIIRKLSKEEMDAYRAPYQDREKRLPTLVWPREIPIDGEPADVLTIVQDYAKFMAASLMPKLLILGDPGRIFAGDAKEFPRSWRNQREVTVKGRHHLQEDSPVEIGTALAEFVKRVRG
jgi:haloalkane dehalogenase